MSYTGRPAARVAEAWGLAESGGMGCDGRGGELVRGCDGRERKESWEERGELGTMRVDNKSAIAGSLLQL